MATTCPSCNTSITYKSFKAIQRHGSNLDKQCPSCDQWMRLNTTAKIVHTAGMLALLAASLLNIVNMFPNLRIEISVLGVIGALCALFITLTGKMIVSKDSNRN
jgi:hypothetical protein